MSRIILVGAGASYGSGACTPHPPPLGKDLFSALRARGGVTATIQEPLASVFRRNFEDGMLAFREHRDSDTTALLREMSCYFAQFEIAQGNHYLTLTSIIASTAVRVTIATTNYDTLLEQAISAAGRLFTYSAPARGKALSLLKLHGSCNFLPDVGRDTYRGVTFSGMSANMDAPIRVARSNEEVWRFCATQDSLAPAIALYAPGKKVLFCPASVSRQREFWDAEVRRATVVYVIGMRVLPEDDHIWGALAGSKARIEYVGLEPDEFLSWAGTHRRRDVHVLERTLAAALPMLREQLRARNR